MPEPTGAFTVSPGGKLLTGCGICDAEPGDDDMGRADGGGDAAPEQAATASTQAAADKVNEKRMAVPF